VHPHPQIHGEGIFASGKIRCVLVHNHVLVRQGLRRLLQDEAELEVVAEAGNAAEALQRVFEERPDVVLADAATMELPADESERLILRESPATRILFLGLPEDGDGGRQGNAARTGSDYISPQTSAEEFVAMVKARMGKSWASHAPENHALADHALGNQARTENDRAGRDRMDKSRLHVQEMPINREREWLPGDAPSSKKRGLTSREREVLKLLAEGQTVRSAAGVLGVSAKTVDAHKFNLMRKLGIHNKAELVMWAIQKRVVKLPVNL
jgi:two-component system, NarL family, response regulator NreC